MKRYFCRKKTAILLVLGLSSVAAMGGMVNSKTAYPEDDAGEPHPTALEPVPGNEVIDIEGQIAHTAMKKRGVQLASLEKKTKEVLHPIEDLSRYEVVEVVATGYTAGVESTGKTEGHPSYGITKSGIKVHRGIYSTIAADPDVFPIGSILYIPGYGYGVVADTGSAIKGNRVDLYFETVDDVYDKWGKRNIKIYVVEKGNGKLTQEQFEKYNHTAKENGLAMP